MCVVMCGGKVDNRMDILGGKGGLLCGILLVCDEGTWWEKTLEGKLEWSWTHVEKLAFIL